MRSLLFSAALAVLAAGAFPLPPALAGPEKIEFPTGYRIGWVRIATIDRYDSKTVRVVYMNPQAWQAAKAGQPLPDGTYIVLEMRSAKIGADGQPLRDENGRFIAEDEVTGLAVQEKRRGWGADYAEDVRNGEWEYAMFNADGTPRANLNTRSCFTCHKPREADDYTFVAARVVNAFKTADGRAK
jgi:hypothetical protein